MPKRTTIVTAALPYANGDIHIGHLVEYVQADIFARHLRAEGETCLYICADDAHGAPIQIRAEQDGVEPDLLVARMRDRHMADFARFDISFDVYHSTHSEENRLLVEEIFRRLAAKGCISQARVDQWYDEAAGRFLADRYVRGRCPRCDAADQYGDGCEACGATFDALELKAPVSALSGTAPTMRSSEHLFFDLAQFTPFLRAYRRELRLQPGVDRKLDEWFDQGLRAWNISRDEPYFGFAIPGHPGKYFYVWMDAPVGYLASLKHYCDGRALDFEHLLNDPSVALVHFIGKDIAYFHTIFWPAMLHAAGMRLPTSVFCHGFLTVEGTKMSKSRGTLIGAAAMADAVDADLFRYFIFASLSDGVEDIDLTLSSLRDRVNAELVGKIVNIGARCSALLQRLSDGALAPHLCDEARFDRYLDGLAEVRRLVRARQYGRACRRLVALAEDTNKWISDRAPWTLAEGGDAERREAAVICTQGLIEFRALMILLAPVTPSLSARALGLFRGAQAPASGTYADLDVRDMLASLSVVAFPRLIERISDAQLARLIAVPA
jgi:methionyl-tRNA synthetase